MSLSLRAAALTVALTVLPGAARAQSNESAQPAADTTAECVRAYEQGQEQRKAGRLVEARQTLQVCARDECPEFIRNDCGVWHGEVQTEVPTLVFVASSQGSDLTDVRVSIGPRLVAARIDGQAIELDPGEYDFDFSAPGMQAVRQRVLVARGQRNRLLHVELPPLDAGTAPPPEQPSGPGPRRLLVPGVLAGVGVLGLSGFAALGAWGRSSEARLRDSCSPNCNKSQISSVRTKYVLADVSLAVGVTGLAAAAYFFFRDGGEERPVQAAAVRLDVQADESGVSAVYGGSF